MNSRQIIRVFPRRTAASPTDDRAFFGPPPLWWPEAEEVHVSVTFTWDRTYGEQLADAWTATGLPVKIGGPAYGDVSGEFVPGRYLKTGRTITSRGCPNRCWFCSVWRRVPRLEQLPIRDGHRVADDNLLACDETHIKAVFAMLKRQPERAIFDGGLEAKRLIPCHVDLLMDLKPARMYFAYDTPDDLEPLHVAGAMLQEAGFTRAGHILCSYVLIGYPGDTFDKAETRLREAWDAGFFPFAMLWRDEGGKQPQEWRAFQRTWARPWSTAVMLGAS